MANAELINISINSIEDLTAVDVLEDIINVINTFKKNKKRPDETTIYQFLNKNLENTDLTKIIINDRLTFMSNNNRITNKLIKWRDFYFVINNESPKPEVNIENQILTDNETSSPKLLPPWTFGRNNGNKKCYS